jgi:hypothetical protein
MSKDITEDLANGLAKCVADYINDVDFQEVAVDHPALKQVGVTALQDAVESLYDSLSTGCYEVAGEFVEEIKGRSPMIPCTNPRCGTERVTEGALLYHWPHPKLVETVGPNDTVPIGLCPECKAQLYMPEEEEEEVDWSADCDCLDCRQERMRVDLISKGVHPAIAANDSSNARDKWESETNAHNPDKPYKDPQHATYTEPHSAGNIPPVDGCACRWCISKRGSAMGLEPSVVQAIVGIEDNTGSTKQGDSDNTGSVTFDAPDHT